jgi:hypothetical protein
VVWSFSSRTTDVEDVFADPQIRRRTIIAGEEAEQ